MHIVEFKKALLVFFFIGSTTLSAQEKPTSLSGPTIPGLKMTISEQVVNALMANRKKIETEQNVLKDLEEKLQSAETSYNEAKKAFENAQKNHALAQNTYETQKDSLKWYVERQENLNKTLENYNKEKDKLNELTSHLEEKVAKGKWSPKKIERKKADIKEQTHDTKERLKALKAILNTFE